MSETYVKNQILEIKKKLSISEIKSAKKVINYLLENPKFTCDHELLFWQVYSREKSLLRSKIITGYIFFTIVILLLFSGGNWCLIKANINFTIAIWLLTPVVFYLVYRIIETNFIQSDNFLAKKILDAYFSDCSNNGKDKIT